MDDSSQQQQQHDPSQMQAYDLSSQQQNYYCDDFNQQHQFQQQEPTTCVPIAPKPAHSSGPSQAHQPNPVQGASDAAGSFNPAAVAVVAGALAQQLSHYAGNVDGMYEQIGPPQYRGRGGRPYRRGGRGHFNSRGRGRGPYRGRGRGRVRDGRHLSSPSSGPDISNVADAPAPEATSVVQPVPLESSHILLLDPTQGPAAPLQPHVVAKLWCEICKAECNSPEILQQHINGKRHKKNLLVHEELQRRRDVSGQQSGQISTPQLNLTIQESETHNLKDETKQQNIVGGTSEVPAGAHEGETSCNSSIQGQGFNHNMKGGRGSKYMRANDGSRKPVEPKQAMSFICELCNVKCESLLAYNSHRAGKKHMANFKRVYGHQHINGESGMQQLQPPDANDLSNSNISQVQQGVSDPQVLLAQLLMTVQTVLSQVQVPATAPLSGPVAAHTQAAAGSSHKQQNLSRASGGSTAHLESEIVNAETKTQLLSATSQLDNTAGPSSKTQTADGRSDTEEKVL